MTITAQKSAHSYAVLGLDRDATPDRIKQAYRMLVLRYHPDRNKAPYATARFCEIAEAYATLSDHVPKSAHDSGGHAGAGVRMSREHVARDVCRGDFLAQAGAEMAGGHNQRPGIVRGRDLRYDLAVTLEEIAAGGERILEVSRVETCPICRGSGVQANVQPSHSLPVSIPFTQASYAPILCAACSAQGYRFLPHRLSVRLPPGVDDGMVIRLAGQGERNLHGGPPGDLLIRVLVRSHPRFRRDGADLATTLSIRFADAVSGAKVSIPCLGGETVTGTIPAGIRSGALLCLHGKGLPRLDGKGKGRLLVTVHVQSGEDFLRAYAPGRQQRPLWSRR